MLLKEYTLFTWKSIPVKASLVSSLMPLLLSLPLVSRYAPIYFVLGFFVYSFIVLIHEMGHAIVGMYFNVEVDVIRFSWYGGYVDYRYHTLTESEIALISSGGVVAQAILAVAALPFLIAFFHMECPDAAMFVLETFVFNNTMILLFNCLPIKHFDGGVFVPFLYKRLFKGRS